MCGRMGFNIHRGISVCSRKKKATHAADIDNHEAFWTVQIPWATETIIHILTPIDP
jgi:hypothetical protein